MLSTPDYLNVSVPQPAMARNIRGARSRAGLMEHAKLTPKDMTRTVNMAPSARGMSPFDGCMLFRSKMARIHTISNAVPTT